MQRMSGASCRHRGMEISDHATHGAWRGVYECSSQSISPEWWHTFLDGLAFCELTRDSPKGMGVYRQCIALGMCGREITPGKVGWGVGKEGTAFPTARETPVRPRGGSLRTCLPGTKAAAGDVTGAVTPPALCQNKASCASCGNIAAMCSSGVIPSANAAMGRNIERYPVSVTPGRGLSW